ncbi:MAG: D-2-hydroxyacid dehydrogenase [Chloroflexi bacterium]|nr:D-2-hydroxyacid dehydrogenase [Chloroflexota bacterium]MYF82274.1 D-2-hydroxyacid dehydrogenase [Chloroflexota bacterium]MYI05090.1 D-2-hydroxyacid dehydrogenase [Chloroflexota bacterium]
MLPPIDDDIREWVVRMREELPELNVVVVEDEADAPRALADADAAYGWVPPEVLPSVERLRLLQNPYAGPFVGWYYPELAQHPVTVSNPRGIYSDHIAQHILMYMLALSRGLTYYMSAQADGRWDRLARKHGYVDLSTATVLINGVGGIGAETARLCAPFGCGVIGVDPGPYGRFDGELVPPTELDKRLAEADFVVTTVPHTPETEFMWNAERFASMKPTAYFINIGRGMTCKLDDLVAALDDGEIAGAGLDVFEIEPLPEGHPLWQMENVIITPHIAVADAANIPERRFELILENARRLVDGREFINVVDKQKWY